MDGIRSKKTGARLLVVIANVTLGLVHLGAYGTLTYFASRKDGETLRFVALVLSPLVLVGLCQVLGAIGFMKGLSWSRLPLRISAILSILNFPIGTACAVLTIIGLQSLPESHSEPAP